MVGFPSTTLNLPTVTEADLYEFHKVMFGTAFDGKGTLTSTVNQHEPSAQHFDGLEEPGQQTHWEEEYEDDDGLGYYPDGVKRTLTDEQIAIFRHSEIQQLLRERRLAREREEGETSSEPEPEENEIKSHRSDKGAEHAVSRDQGPGDKEVKTGEYNDDGIDDEEEREYAEFLRAERLEFQRAAAAKRNGERTIYDPSDRTISTRRKVREMDDIGMSVDTLMYDDCDTAAAEPATAQSQVKSHGSQHAVTKHSMLENTKSQGRKFWWPEIRPEG